jgi:nicotinate phosphoribosyltransferase
MGTIPHALILVFGSTLQAAKAYHATHPDERLIVLIDTFNRECTDSIELVKTFGKALYAVRIDTHGDIVAEGNQDGDKGVTVGAVRALRKALDSAGGQHVKIIASSGFDPAKTRGFIQAGAPIDAIGTGSFIETRDATADIVEVDGKPFTKTGRAYHPNPRLKLVN